MDQSRIAFFIKKDVRVAVSSAWTKSWRCGVLADGVFFYKKFYKKSGCIRNADVRFAVSFTSPPGHPHPRPRSRLCKADVRVSAKQMSASTKWCGVVRCGAVYSTMSSIRKAAGLFL
jgi:hypothetical protein